MKSIYRAKCWAVIDDGETITYFSSRKSAREFIRNWDINGRECKVEVTTKIVK